LTLAAALAIGMGERTGAMGCCPIPIADERSANAANGCCRMTNRKTAVANKRREISLPLLRNNNPLRRGYEVAEIAVRAVIAGHKPMQMICSKAGLGKTYLVNRELRRAGIKPATISPQNYPALAETLYRLRDHPVVVLDDCDMLARSERVANIFKQAFGPTRTVNYESKQTLAVDRFPRPLTDALALMPSSFRVNARLIWLSNINFTDPTIVTDAMAPHFRAMVSRGLDPIWIDSDDDADQFDFILWLVIERHMLRSHGFPREVTVAALNWFVEHRNCIKELSPRTLVRIADGFRQYPDEHNRELMLGLMLAPKPLRNIPGISLLGITGHEWQTR
jgi:hypothetical protein